MSLVESLRDAQDEVLSEASQALQRAHLVHYEAAGAEESRHRLEDLYDLTLEPICRFAETVSRGRFEAGFDIAEVQTAFNVLEEAIWHVVVSRLPAEDLAEATGLVGTVIGAGKDTLARTWVSLAAKRHVASLDLSALFRGATS